MKNLLITANCLIKGVPYEVGDIVKDLDDLTAAEALAGGRAKIHVGTVEKEKPKKKAAKKAAKKSS